jgi:hypothetical protein
MDLTFVYHGRWSFEAACCFTVSFKNNKKKKISWTARRRSDGEDKQTLRDNMSEPAKQPSSLAPPTDIVGYMLVLA